jgi:hypothetical protein
LGHPARRLDLDTQWTKEFGHVSAKEALTHTKMENGSEETVLRVRKPAMKLAEKFFQ